MYVIKCSSPDEGLAETLATLLRSGPVETSSRNGPVLKFKTPVTIVNENPRNRVSFSPVRDCNPFLHLFESLWMLAGRNDVAFLRYFTEQMTAYSDDGVVLNGAYGHRWINHFNIDQIHDFVIPELRANPDSRRCVLSMWDGHREPKLLTGPGTLDSPCNLQVVFSREGQDFDQLRMTVFNRSNDIVWGTFGANIVHFSILQEYVACALGLEVESYYQVSNNMHLYTENPVVRRLIAPNTDNVVPGTKPSFFTHDLEDRKVLPSSLSPVLFDSEQEHGRFTSDLTDLFSAFDATVPDVSQKDQKVFRSKITPLLSEFVSSKEWQSKFFRLVVGPMLTAKTMYEEGNLGSAIQGLLLRNQDWNSAARQWLQRRREARMGK